MIDAEQSEFSKVLVALRIKRRMSMEVLANKSGVHRNTLTRIMRNPESARVREIIKIGDALGVPEWKVFRYVRRVSS